MLGPHHRENTQFGQIWYTPVENFEDLCVFFIRYAMLGDDCRGDFTQEFIPQLNGDRCPFHSK